MSRSHIGSGRLGGRCRRTDQIRARQRFDGQWVGTATQGNVSKTVTITPDGTVIAR
jgi:hypothetical protein